MADTGIDKELVEQVLAGRTEAFNLLVWKWQRPLLNFMLRLTGNRDWSNDLMQESLLRAFLHIKELRTPERFGVWLFRIATNVYRSEARLRHQEFTVEDEVDAPISSRGSGDYLPNLRWSVRSAMAMLPADKREVVVLKVYHGFLFDEIALILGCPVSTVKTRYYSALEELRTSLEPASTHPLHSIPLQ